MTTFGPRRFRGAALVLVLWLIALLTALVGAFALSAQIEHLQQRVQDDTGRAEEIGRAGIAYALSRLRADAQRPPWQADGRLYRWRFDGAQVDLRIEDESGKINLILADAALLAAFLRALDVAEGEAAQLAGAIVDWRDADDLSPPGGGAEAGDYAAAGLAYGPRNARMETIGELQRVLGMSPALYRQMRPMVTVHGRQARPDARSARGPVLTALGLDAALVLAQRQQSWSRPQDPSQPPAVATGSGTYSIECRVTDERGRTALSRAIVRNAPSQAMGRAYTVLEWEQGMAAK